MGTSLMVRTMLVALGSTTFVLTTDGAQLMTGLHQHARLGARGTYAVLAGYRMLEQLPERWATVRLGQGAREPSRPGPARRRRRSAGPPRTPRAVGRAAFTLLMVTLRQAERMSIAMETRGLGSGPRTVHRPVALDALDGVFAVATLGVVAALPPPSSACWPPGVRSARRTRP